jgi:acyl dehydratase
MSLPDDLQPGRVIESPSKTLTEAHFLFFSGLTGDSHPIHYDVDYAKRAGFGKPIAHGLLLAAMTAFGATAASQSAHGLIFVEQGSRFLKPVVVGDTIRPRLTVERIWQDGRRRFIRFATAILNQRDETVLEGFHVYLLRDTPDKEKPQ